MTTASQGNKKIYLGDLLVKAGVISGDQLKEALEKQKNAGKRLGQFLLDEGYLTQEALTRALESQLGIESVDLDRITIEPKIASMIPENLARRHVVMPIQMNKGHLYLAMRDPLDQIAIQDVRLLVQVPVIPVLATERNILDTIKRVFIQANAVKVAEDFIQGQADALAGLEESSLVVNSAPIVRLVNSFIENAVRSGASDIHIEPNYDQMRVRIRVDGVLQEMLTTDLNTHGAVASRVKIMAGLNISEKRLPQDGRIMTMVDNREIDLRISLVPTIHGEKIVFRVLDRDRFMLGKENMGFSSEDLGKFSNLVNKPYGIILVTGPTGSGKTTTLYAMLSELNDEKKNIVTLEDPIEYNMKGINQTPIMNKAGLTFASGLRSMLRQDPDIIMVGEIRDSETADISSRAALTGHLVLSTLHANNAAGAVARLVDMGVEPYILSSSIIGVVAQRLVRKICPFCREEKEAGEREKLIMGWESQDVLIIYQGKGCGYCNETGFKGRVGLFEIIEVDKEIRLLVDRKASTDELHEAAVRGGMTTLWMDGRQKVLEGVTTLEEVLRVANWS